MTHKNDGIQKSEQNTRVSSVDLMAFEALQQLFHELKIHRMPPDMQNEELISMQAELYAANVRFFNFLDQSPVGCLSVCENGFIMDANLTACNMLGVDRGALIKQAITSFIHPKDQNLYYQYHNHILDDGDQQTCDLQMLKRSGTTFWTRLEETVKQNVVGMKECFITIDDIYKSEIKDYEHELMESFIRLASAPGDFHEHMSNLISSLQQWSGCEAVGVRLRDKNDYPYFETHGFLPEFITMENYLAVHDISGKILCDDTGEPMLECMCGNILSGRFDPAKPFFTANGSFWSNNTTTLLADTTDSDSQAHTCKRCNAEGYESVALIPLRVKGQVLGLLQFSDHHQNRFTTDMIGYLEKMANSLAIVLSRHQIDEALLASENRYRCIIDGLTDYHYLVHIKNNNDMHAIHNPDCEKVTGYTVDEFTANPDIWIQMVAQEERDIVTAHMQRILKEINFPPIEHRIIRKDGKTRWVRNTVILNKDELGNLMSYDGLMQDITEHKEAEESLKQAHLLLKQSLRFTEALLSAIPTPVFHKDKEGRYLGCNRAYTDIMGVTSEALKGKTAMELWPGEMAETYHANDLELMSHPARQVYEYKVLDKDGVEHPVIFAKDVFRDEHDKVAGIVGAFLDITERKQAEEKVFHSSQMFQRVLDNISGGVFWKDHNLIYLGCNSTCADAAGLNCPDEIIGKNDYDLSWKASAEAYQEDDRYVMESGIPKLNYKESLPQLDGSISDIITNKVPMFDKNGNILGMLGTFEDITERNRIEIKLHDSEEMLRSIMSNARDGIIMLNNEGRISYWNQAAETILGYVAAEALGKKLHKLLALEYYRDTDNKGFAHFCITGKEMDFGKTIELNALIKDGNRVLVEMSISTVKVKEQLTILCIIRDITERKKAESAIALSNSLLSATLESTADGIMVADGNGNVTSFNTRFLELWHIPQELAACMDDDKLLRHVLGQLAEPEAFLSKVRELYLTPQAESFDELKFQDERIFERFSKPQRLDDEIVGRVWSFRDITERKRTQSELKNFQKQLVEASRRGGMAEIATNILHNVGNVLNSVNISIDLIVDSVKNSKVFNLTRVLALLEEHTQDLGAFITTDSRGKHIPAHLAQLSENLLADQATLGKELDLLKKNIEHIKEIVAIQHSYANFGGVKEIINVVTLVEDSLRMNEDALGRYQMKVTREFDKVPLLNLDKHKILQILVNLMRNSKHACQESKCTDPHLTVRVVNGDCRVKISVIDNGIGIPPENITFIFNHGFTTRKDGLGFGLHSSALAAMEMGGSLNAHSDGFGQGATFTLELPYPLQENNNE
jgi:PAS domain S-box-containing protein